MRRDVDPPELNDQDKEEYFDGFGEDGLPPNAVARVKFPGTRPYFTSMIADEEGFLLLKLPQRDDEDASFDVFDPEGAFIGTVTIPDLSTRATFRHGFVYSPWYPEEELPGVVRYRLAGAGGGAVAP